MGGTNLTDHMELWRTLDPSVTASFTNGRTTWFSFVSVRGNSANPQGMRIALGHAGSISFPLPINGVETTLLGEDRGGKAGGEAIGGGGSSIKNGYKILSQFWDSVTGSPGETNTIGPTTPNTFSNYDIGGIQPGSGSDHAVSALTPLARWESGQSDRSLGQSGRAGLHAGQSRRHQRGVAQQPPPTSSSAKSHGTPVARMSFPWAPSGPATA